jgi:hypothetical protein
MIRLFDEIKRTGTMRIIGTNFHIITDRDLKRLRDRDIELGKLRRKITERQIEGILDGKSHVARNPVRRKAA